MTTPFLLQDAETALLRVVQAGEISVLEEVFIAWLDGQTTWPSSATRPSAPLRSYIEVSIVAVAEAAGWEIDPQRFDDGLRWLSAVALERVAGVPAPVIGDGLAQVALGLAARSRAWFAEWHDRVLEAATTNVTPPWLGGAGVIVRGRTATCAPEVRLALAARGATENVEADGPALLGRLIQGWMPDDALHAQVTLAALQWIRRAAPVVLPGQATPAAVADLLRSVPRALQQWPWEEKPKTKNSRAAKWQVDNEYHVQSLLWAILAPVFPDLKREDYAAQVGPIQPRVDFGLPSLRLLVEAKFARDRSALKDVVKEIAQDASTYFATPQDYDRLLVFVWDNAGNTQDHDQIIGGLRKFERVFDAVIVSRPGHMAEVTGLTPSGGREEA